MSETETMNEKKKFLDKKVSFKVHSSASYNCDNNMCDHYIMSMIRLL
jgi:hypothetical protein